MKKTCYNIQDFQNPIDEAKNKNILKYNDPEMNGEILLIELICEILEYY